MPVVSPRSSAVPACRFVPPYLLQRLAADAGEVELRAQHESTLLVDEHFRTTRAAAPARLLAPATVEVTRVVHTAGQTEELPGVPVRSDGERPSGDVAVDEAFDSAGEVWALFEAEFARRSVDGQGTPLTITVHYGRNYENAFWDGRQLVFGDGDGEIFERFTKPMDVMAHEFAHGVVQFAAGLVYRGEPGALNESVCDVFAALTKQRSQGQTADQADWLIGAGLFRPGVQAVALRSMLDPGTAYDDPRLGRDPQVGSMADYVETEEDAGGVHLNSGIPNRAFALAAVALGGRSWERAGRVWYDALVSGEVGPEADFATFARATLSSAGRLFADQPEVAEQVRGGWLEVGVLLDPTAEPVPASEPAPAPVVTTVVVRRTGGFAGLVREAELDLDADPAGPQVRELLDRADLPHLGVSPPGADRFVYDLRYEGTEVRVPEQALTPELRQVVQLVLGRQNLDPE